MADLPDINTVNVGIIAFWNALDHRVVPGVGDVDPSDCTGVFDSYSVYDNGIEGYKALGSGRYFHARVKTDGWFVAWIDRTNLFDWPDKLSTDFGETGLKGYYDICYNWFNAKANISATQTTLSYLIYTLYNALTNKADFTFLDADVGHYCYEYPLADVLTLMDVQVTAYRAGFTVGCGALYQQTGQFQYTVGTTLYYAAIAVSTAEYHEGALNWYTYADFDGNILKTWSSNLRYASADLKAEGWVPTASTDYSLYCKGQCCGTGVQNQNFSYTNGAILVIWK